MPAYMNGKTGAWYVQCYYSDIDGNRKHKVKRGFATKGEALAWETEFLACADGSMSMPFEAFVKRYSEDVRPRLKLNTWLTKEHIIRTKIVPFFGPKRMCDISPKDVVDWQNKMVGSYDDEGKPYSGTYLRTINNQLSAIFNHAVKYYGLGKSPAAPTIVDLSHPHGWLFRISEAQPHDRAAHRRAREGERRPQGGVRARRAGRLGREGGGSGVYLHTDI